MLLGRPRLGYVDLRADSLNQEDRTSGDWSAAELGTRSDEAMQWSGMPFIASISLSALNASSLQCLNFLLELTVYHFIESKICLCCLNTWTKTIRKWWINEAVICIGNLSKILIFEYNFHSKVEQYCCLCFHMCQKTFCYCYVEILAWTRIVFTAMKRWRKVMKCWTLYCFNFPKH